MLLIREIDGEMVKFVSELYGDEVDVTGRDEQ